MRPRTKVRMVAEAATFFAGVGGGFALAYLVVWPMQLNLIQKLLSCLQ
jgi:fatty acid desaturase